MKINVYTNKHVPGAEYCVYTAIGTQAVKKGEKTKRAGGVSRGGGGWSCTESAQ